MLLTYCTIKKENITTLKDCLMLIYISIFRMSNQNQNQNHRTQLYIKMATYFSVLRHVFQYENDTYKCQ